jgi:hypothetical protein
MLVCELLLRKIILASKCRGGNSGSIAVQFPKSDGLTGTLQHDLARLYVTKHEPMGSYGARSDEMRDFGFIAQTEAFDTFLDKAIGVCNSLVLLHFKEMNHRAGS